MCIRDSLLLVLVGFLTFMFRRNVVKWSLGVLEASYGGHLALSTPLEPLITEAVGVAVLFFVFLSMIYLAFNLYINVKTLDITRLRELKW